MLESRGGIVDRVSVIQLTETKWLVIDESPGRLARELFSSEEAARALAAELRSGRVQKNAPEV